MDNLTSILNLNESTDWLGPQSISQLDGSYTNWTFYPPYAGYVVVNVAAASTPLTYIQVTYSLNTGGPDGLGYNNQVWCGWDSLNGGMGTFPILPVPVEIRVGNTANTDNYTNTVLVEITYYY